MSDLAWSGLAGFLLSAAVSLAAWRGKLLSQSGSLAAALFGAIIFGLGGFGWAILLLAFFLSSSLLSLLFTRRKHKLEEKFSKGSRRDAGQVAANGGTAGAFVLLHLLFPDAVWPWMGYAGALAAANADTWATELGVLARGAPRLITTGQPVERGTSGGVSLPGLLASLGGAFIIALLAGLFWQGHVLDAPGAPGWLAYILGANRAPLSGAQAPAWLAIITLAGVAGSLLDSLLGATVQAISFCPACQKETERRPLHLCGAPTQHLRGLRWLNNDWVNFFCTLAGAAVAVLAALF